MLQGAILSIISAIFYGSMAVLAKLAYELGMNEFEMLLCRFFFGTLMLGTWIAIRNPRRFRIKPKPLLALLVIGVVVYTTQSICFFRSVKYVPASITALIFYGYPATVTLLSALVFRMKLSRVVVGSVLAVSAGCALVYYDAFTRGADTTGILYAFGAMAVFSGYLILCQVVVKGLNPLTMTFYMILFTGLGFCLYENPVVLLELSGRQLALGALLGLVPTALAVSLLFVAIEKIGSAWASVFSSIEPVATLLFAHALLGEQVVAWQFAGTGLILLGIVLPNLAAMREKRKLARAS